MNGSAPDARLGVMMLDALTCHYGNECIGTFAPNDQRIGTRSTPGIEMPGYVNEVPGGGWAGMMVLQ
jgi:hypothetical protein